VKRRGDAEDSATNSIQPQKKHGKHPEALARTEGQAEQPNGDNQVLREQRLLQSPPTTAV